MQQPGKRKALAAILSVAIILCIISIGTLAFLPAYFSTPQGKESLVNWINRRISGWVSIDTLKISWFSGQQIENLILYDKRGDKIFALENLTTNKNLLPLLSRTNSWGKTRIHGLFLHLVKEGNGSFNLEEAIQPKNSKEKKSKKERKFTLPTRGDLRLEDGVFEMEGPKTPLVVLSHLNFTLQGEKKDCQTIFHLVGKSAQKSQISGTQTISPSISGEILVSGRLTSCKRIKVNFTHGTLKGFEKMSLSLLARLNSFPVAVFDQIIRFKNLHLAGIFESAIGPSLDFEGEIIASKKELKIDSSIIGSNLKATIKGATEEGIFHADPKSKIVFTITPPFFEKLLLALNKNSKWHLGKKTDISINLEKLSFPIPFVRRDLAFKLDGSIDQALISHETLGPITLRNISLSSSSSPLTKEINIEYTGDIQTSESPSKFEGRIDAANLFDAKGNLSLSQGKLEFYTALSSVPLDAIDLALGENSDLMAYFGRTLSLFFHGKIEKGVGDIQAKATSTILQTEELFFKFDHGLFLEKNGKITFRLSPDLLKKFLPYETEIRVMEGGYLTLDLQELSLPLNERGGWDYEKLKLNANLSMGSVNIQGITHFSPLLIKDVSGKITIANLNRVSLLLKGIFGFTNSHEYVALIVGSDCPFTLSGEGAIPKKKGSAPLTFSNLSFKTECERINLDVRGKIDETGLFSITRPALSTLTITPDSFSQWVKASNNNPSRLVEESRMRTEVDYFECRLFPFQPRTLIAKSVTTLPKLAMLEASNKELASISDLEMQVNINGKNEEFFANINGKTHIELQDPEKKESKSGQIDALLSIKQFLKAGTFSLRSADFRADVTAKDFPLFILDAFILQKSLSQGGFLTTLFGPSLDFTLRGSHTPEKEPKSIILFSATGEGLKANLSLSIDGTLKVMQDHPAFIEWTMTPARYATLMSIFQKESHLKSNYTLLNSAPVILKISQLNCPALPIPSIGGFLCQSGFIGTLQTGPMTLMNHATHDSIAIQRVDASVHGRNFSEAIQLNIASDFLSNNATESGDLRFQGGLINAWTKEGKWNKEGLTIKGNLHINNLPVRPILSLTALSPRREREIFALLGEKLNTNIFGEITDFSGPIDIQIAASNFKAEAPFTLNQGNLTLRETLKAEITLTQEISETFLVDIYPLLFEAVLSNHPLLLNIGSDGFFLPLSPFSFGEIKIPHAIIDIGEISVKNGGQLQALMNFLKAQNISPVGMMSAWFTPIYLSLENGIASYERFDALLAGNVHIACWGQINHIKDKVNMVLAISAATLRHKLGISGLSKRDMFQIKMRGSTHKVELDWSSAYKRIAIIIAEAAGGPGYIVSGLLELLGGMLGEEPTPPPTTHPFPWKKTTSK